MNVLANTTLALWVGLASVGAQAQPDANAARDQWLKTKKELESEGIEFGLENYTRNSIPEAENFAAHPLLAETYTPEAKDDSESTRLGKLKLDHRRPKYDEAKLFSLAGLAGDLELDRNAAAEKVLEGFEKWNSTLDELVAAAGRPHCRFPISPERLATSVANSVPFSGSKYLSLRALGRIQLDEKTAATDTDALLRLTNHASSNQSLIGLLITIATDRRALMCLREGIALERWKESDLALFDQHLAKLDFASSYAAAASFEVAFAEHLTIRAIDGDLGADEMIMFTLDEEDLPSDSELYAQLEAISRAHFDHFFKGRTGRSCLTPENLKRLDGFADAPINLDKALSPGDAARSTMRALYISGTRCLREQANVNLARIAIALERHRLKHGKLPASLDALVPEFLPALPHDPITSRPPKFRVAKNGEPIIYSFGLDGDDDGGQRPDAENRSNPEAEGDWVWRVPAR